MIGTRLAGRYEMLGKLGKGGMAVVYRARDPRLDREVAIKMISTSGLSESVVERFQREAQTVAGLDHPSIVPIYDFGRHGSEDESWLFFVMPVLQGVTLHRLLRKRRLPLDTTLEILACSAEALDHSASHGVVHRDVKPENVMVALDGDQVSRVWVMDFGLALGRKSSRLTDSGNLPGTLAYLSPEQILGEELDGRSDLYSLGTILYECLAGKPPFTGPQASVLYRIVHDPAPSLDGKGVDPRLQAIVMACLAKRPEDRWQSGHELAEALRAYGRELSRGDDPDRRLPVAALTGAGETPLVGRDGELGELRRRLEAALDGGCQLVLLGGERGMGKTRLLRELEAEALEREVLVLHGRFSGREGGFAYEAFGELILDFFRPGRGSSSSMEATPRRPSVDLADLAPELLALFPALADIPELCGAALAPGRSIVDASGGREDSLRIFEVLARTFLRLAAGRPLVLLVEQLHTADPSVSLLQYLVRRMGPTPTLIVCTYRPSAIGKRHPVRRLARALHDEPRCAVIDLPPLGAADHRQLLAELMPGAHLDDAVSAKLYDATEGSPFFTEEMVRNLVDEGNLRDSGTGFWQLSDDSRLSGELPDSVQQAVETRLERLDDGLQRVLGMASVLGRRFELHDLEELHGGRRAAAGAPESDGGPGLTADDGEVGGATADGGAGEAPSDGGAPELEAAVDALVARGLLAEVRHRRGDWFQFGSALVREVVYLRQPRRRRRRLHRRHARALEERHRGRLERVYGRLMHHYFEADEPEKTVAYARLLARRSIDAYSWEDAAQAARTALEYVDDDVVSSKLEGELRLVLARALAAQGSAEPSLREAARAVEASLRGGAPDQAALGCLIQAETAWKYRRPEEMEAALEQGLTLPRESLDPGTVASLLTLASTAANLRGEYHRARRYLEEARRSRLPGGEREEVAEPAEGGRLRVAMALAPRILDPARCLSIQEAEVMAVVFETLVRLDESGNLVPHLCRAVAASEDVRSFVFQLRRGLRFSDGTPLDAGAVRRSLESVARLGADRFRACLQSIQGYEAFVAGERRHLEGLVVRGELEIEIRLSRPMSIFPAFLSSVGLGITRRRDERILGSGPFAIVGADSGRVLLERNSEARRPPRLEHLEFHAYLDSRAVAQALRSGEVDLARDLAPAEIEDFLHSPRFGSSLAEIALPSTGFVVFNRRGPKLRDRQLRRLLAGVIDNRELVWRRLARFVLPASGWIPPGIPGFDPDPTRPRPVDRFEAVEAMQAYTPLPVTLRALVHPLFATNYRQLTEALFAEWALLGVDVEV
ncbi:MAG: ABC transporter substrate-binding protein, partial [Holophagales bacterium]|nr:ABC transporter substrate-binding protein [Holophagales bacterium]